MAFQAEQLLKFINAGPPSSGLIVAFSGGRDSSVLLHALSTLRDRLPAPLRAIHVNHGLHPDAAQWTQHCERFAASLGIEYSSKTVEIDPADPRGLEAAARAARYAAFKSELRSGEWLLTAHHADDQLETVLLQLLRGGGPAGIAAMPSRTDFGAGMLARPLLNVPRDELVAYAKANGLNYIDDPSNQDQQRDRNYLRHEIVPRLKRRWPAAAKTASRAARHAGRAKSLLNDLAALDLAGLRAEDPETLPVDAVLSLGQARAENLLRHWLAVRGLPLPNTRRLDELLSQAATAAGDRAPQVTWPGAEVRCWRGRIYAFAPPSEPAPLPAVWHGEPLKLGPDLGELRTVAADQGLRPDILAEGVEIRWRHGGERIRPAGHRHHRDLKDLLREVGIPPWMRGRIPLLWFNGTLAAVGDSWVASEVRAPRNKPGIRIEWHSR